MGEVNPKPDEATHVVLSGSLHIKVWVKRKHTEDGWRMWSLYTMGKWVEYAGVNDKVRMFDLSELGV